MFPVKDGFTGEMKYATCSRALVVDNRDPLQKGRIIVDHPQLGQTTWIPYLNTPGMFDVPKIGDIVMVESESGFYTHPIAWGNLHRVFPDNPDISNIPLTFQRQVPSARGLFTPGGHTIVLDDGLAEEITPEPNDTNLSSVGRGIKITTKAGNLVHILEDTVEGNRYILLQDINGNFIKIDTALNKVTISTVGDQHQVVGGVLTLDVTGNINITTNGKTNISSEGDVSVSSNGKATVNAQGAVLVESLATATVQAPSVILKSSANTLNGGVVTNNTVNNDPITGIPLQPVGGVITSS